MSSVLINFVFSGGHAIAILSNYTYLLVILGV